MTKPKVTVKKMLLLIVSLLVLVAAGFVMYIVYTTHSSSVSFQEYAPKTLPAGITITGKSVDIWSEKTSLVAHTKELTFDLNTSHSFISEEKNTMFSYTCDQRVINETCVTAETLNHQKYQLTTSYEQTLTGKPFEQTVAWLKGNTYIWITLQGGPVHTYSQQEWSKVVDSFVPVHYGKITINHYSPGP